MGDIFYLERSAWENMATFIKTKTFIALWANQKIKGRVKTSARIVDEHLNQIRLLLKDNEKLKDEIFEKIIAEDELKIVK